MISLILNNLLHSLQGCVWHKKILIRSMEKDKMVVEVLVVVVVLDYEKVVAASVVSVFWLE